MLLCLSFFSFLRGMDVAAFMWCVDYLLTFHLDELASDAVVLKWHSKTLQTWRDSLSDVFFFLPLFPPPFFLLIPFQSITTTAIFFKI